MNNNYNGSNIVCATICIVSTMYWLYNDNKLIHKKLSILSTNMYEINEKCDKNKELSINISKEIKFVNKEWQQELVKDQLEKVMAHHFPSPMSESDEEDLQTLNMDED